MRVCNNPYFDAVVLGSGIAGLSFALKVAAQGRRVLIITKKTRAESNTNYAQGGIASVTSQTDDFELHVRDTLEAGDGLCDEAVVRAIVREGPDRIRELAELGVGFSQLDDGRISLGKEGGHSKRRILHVADVTGKAIEEALLRAIAAHPDIELREHCFAIDLITLSKLAQRGENRAAATLESGGDRVVGIYFLDTQTGQVERVAAGAVLLATGGVGHVYQYTTNPDIATGDGIAMAYRAGAPVANMEFIQFHPTSLYTLTSERFLISEAVRGEGAILRNSDGEPFMERFHPRADLASRDIVARAIDSEMKRLGSKHVWLDITGRPSAELARRFPNIHATCQKHGIEMAKDWIPVVPAAHYLCGGVCCNPDTSTVLPGLHACGEVACTGLHGANRLASNSLLEAVVMAHRGAAAVNAFLARNPFPAAVPLPAWTGGDLNDSDERVVLSHNLGELKHTMWDYVGIVRTERRLLRARRRIENLAAEIDEYYWNFRVEPALLELRNLVQVASLVVECALQRKESRGLHYILDYPDHRPEAQDTIVSKPVSPDSPQRSDRSMPGRLARS